MNAEQLKALQAPIKERYKKDPDAALMQTIRNAVPVRVS